jgi:hypothetical protein
VAEGANAPVQINARFLPKPERDTGRLEMLLDEHHALAQERFLEQHPIASFISRREVTATFR